MRGDGGQGGAKERGVVLMLETSARTCSVALFEGGVCLAGRAVRGEDGAGYVHAEVLLTLIDEVHREAGMPRNAADAVAVSAGPGSYTGLRIGLSTAKGIAHALGKPLLMLDTLEVLCCRAEGEGRRGPVLAVLDARRNEVYAAVFAPREGGGWHRLEETRPVVLEGMPWEVWKDGMPENLMILGDAAEKTAQALEPYKPMGGWGAVVTCDPEARFAGGLVERARREGLWADLAYATPKYLKEFVAGTPRNLLGTPAADRNFPSQG
ncbi:MAG: hypothetical protein RJA19_1751 [Bacteroidota bacterium]